MPLPPPRDHSIGLTEAAALTKAFRDSAGSGAVIAGMFHTAAIQGLTGQSGVAGVRIYHGKQADGTPAMVCVGVDENGDDLETGILLDEEYPCPPFCSAANALNS